MDPQDVTAFDCPDPPNGLADLLKDARDAIEWLSLPNHARNGLPLPKTDIVAKIDAALFEIDWQ